MDGWTDRRTDEQTDGTDKANTRFSQLLNEVPTIDFFKSELARCNSCGQPVPNVKEQTDLEISATICSSYLVPPRRPSRRARP